MVSTYRNLLGGLCVASAFVWPALWLWGAIGGTDRSQVALIAFLVSMGLSLGALACIALIWRLDKIREAVHAVVVFVVSQLGSFACPVLFVALTDRFGQLGAAKLLLWLGLALYVLGLAEVVLTAHALTAHDHSDP